MLRIKKQLENYLTTLVGNEFSIVLSHPEKSEHGDYSSNLAFLLAKKEKKAPVIIAQELAEKVSQHQPEYVEKIEAVAPGFLNFYLKTERYFDYLKEDEEVKGSFSGKKVMIEFTDPNPFKEFHIGHLYSNIVGESISRLLEATGADVIRACYQGDVGLHVAKAIYGMQEKLSTESLELSNLEEKPLEERAKFLGDSYALGAGAYEEDEIAKKAIVELNKEIFAHDPRVKELYEHGRSWSLDYFEQIYQRLGTNFEKYYLESEVGEKGKELVEEYLRRGVFEKSEGATIFPGEKYGLHSRVFINSLGLPTYEAKELGLAIQKKQDVPELDMSIVITGNEINEYFKVLLKALEQIEPELARKTRHISHGMVRLPEGKMSSRTGNVITGEWLLEEVYKKEWMEIQKLTMTRVDEKGISWSKNARVEFPEQAKVAEFVAIGAVKYALLKSGIGKDIEFNIDESISFEGNSGPYLQYTYVRTRSVLNKAGGLSNNYQLSTTNYQLNGEELELLKYLSRFDEVILVSAEKFSPSTLATYLFELAQHFNLFYQKYPILKQEEQVTQFRIRLTSSVGNTIKEGLRLLGIQTPEKM